MAVEMFASPEPWPIVEAAQAMRLATIGPPDPDVQPEPDTWIANLGALPLIAQPGERWLVQHRSQVLGFCSPERPGRPSPKCCGLRVFDRSACVTPA